MLNFNCKHTLTHTHF